MEIEGGRAGHEVVPLERAGLYAPGGRYPLVSSVLMTAIPARVAGVEEVLRRAHADLLQARTAREHTG